MKDYNSVKYRMGIFTIFNPYISIEVIQISYRIDYDSVFTNPRRSNSCRIRRFIISTLCFILFMTLSKLYWPRGWNLFMRLLIPGEPQITLGAAECFLEEIQEGAGFCDAALDFCRTVIKYG